MGGGTKPCENPGVDQYRVHRDELARILAESTGNLSRKDMHIWKLLHKFHDDPQLVSLDGTTACSETHDVPLAERTRLKNSCIRTATEKEWISLDKVLNPTVSRSVALVCIAIDTEQVWPRYTRRDAMFLIPHTKLPCRVAL